MAIFMFSLLVASFLAFANGANDNFKGVATLYGSGTTSFRRALGWATVTTAAGSVAALVMAKGLLAVFSGKGLVPDVVAASPVFSMAVALSAACTVSLATKFGFPISTTHALTGALAGAGIMASPVGIDGSKFFSLFLLPLLASPLMAVLLACVVYPLFCLVRERVGIKADSCLCIGTEISAPLSLAGGAQKFEAVPVAEALSVATGNIESCDTRYHGRFAGISAGPTMDQLHFLSAGIVSFARGLNDTPKIAAILLAGASLPVSWTIILVAMFMLVGGLMNSRKVAETMARKVTKMDPGQGFTANLITGGLVVFASKFGLPVSTTHVSCGSLFGIGSVTRQANWAVIRGILLAWITTLPLSAGFGALFYFGAQIFVG